MSIGMLVYSEFLIDLDHDSELFGQFTRQTDREIFSFLPGAPWKFPHPPQKPTGRTPGDQHFSIAFENTCSHGDVGHDRARLHHRALFLNPQFAGLAELVDWAK